MGMSVDMDNIVYDGSGKPSTCDAESPLSHPFELAKGQPVNKSTPTQNPPTNEPSVITERALAVIAAWRVETERRVAPYLNHRTIGEYCEASRRDDELVQALADAGLLVSQPELTDTDTSLSRAFPGFGDAPTALNNLGIRS
jgi:hypothetical protein